MAYKPFFKETGNWRDYEDEGEEGDDSNYRIGDKFKIPNKHIAAIINITKNYPYPDAGYSYTLKGSPSGKIASHVMENLIDGWLESGAWVQI